MSEAFLKTPKRLILACVFLFAGADLKVSANELIQTLQNETSVLKKRVEDLRVSLAKSQQSEAATKAKLEQAENEIGVLKSRLSKALRRAELAEARREEADEQTVQAVATLKEMKSFVQKQSDAVLAQKEEISETEGKNQILQLKQTEAEAAREAALKTVSTVRVEAEEARQKAIREEAKSHYNLGVVLARHRKSEAAAKQFQACLALTPEDADAHYNLGILYEGPLKSRSKAISHYKRFLELRPSGSDADKVSTWLEEIQ